VGGGRRDIAELQQLLAPCPAITPGRIRAIAAQGDGPPVRAILQLDAMDPAGVSTTGGLESSRSTFGTVTGWLVANRAAEAFGIVQLAR